MWLSDSSSQTLGNNRLALHNEVPPHLERTSTGLSIISKVSSLPQAKAVVISEDGKCCLFQ